MSYNHVFFSSNGGLVSEANDITAKIGVDLLVSERRRNKAPSLSLSNPPTITYKDRAKLFGQKGCRVRSCVITEVKKRRRERPAAPTANCKEREQEENKV
jgi:hypothetical protein